VLRRGDHLENLGTAMPRTRSWLLIFNESGCDSTYHVDLFELISREWFIQKRLLLWFAFSADGSSTSEFVVASWVRFGAAMNRLAIDFHSFYRSISNDHERTHRQAGWERGGGGGVLFLSVVVQTVLADEQTVSKVMRAGASS
jgi:hypothetical protein